MNNTYVELEISGSKETLTALRTAVNNSTDPLYNDFVAEGDGEDGLIWTPTRFEVTGYYDTEIFTWMRLAAERFPALAYSVTAVDSNEDFHTEVHIENGVEWSVSDTYYGYPDADVDDFVGFFLDDAEVEGNWEEDETVTVRTYMEFLSVNEGFQFRDFVATAVETDETDNSTVITFTRKSYLSLAREFVDEVRTHGWEQLLAEEDVREQFGDLVKSNTLRSASYHWFEHTAPYAEPHPVVQVAIPVDVKVQGRVDLYHIHRDSEHVVFVTVEDDHAVFTLVGGPEGWHESQGEEDHE